MAHLEQIIWLLILPVAIWFSYRLILFLLNRIEKKSPSEFPKYPGGNS